MSNPQRNKLAQGICLAIAGLMVISTPTVASADNTTG